MNKVSPLDSKVHNNSINDQTVIQQNEEEINNNNNQRIRTTSLNSFYSVKSWKSVATGDADFYSICSGESFKST